MDIVYLIGNGFDINLGLPTRYVDFYNYYLSLNISSASTNINKLKHHLRESLSSNDKYWSDLELAMGAYTSELANFNEVEEVYDDLNDEMQNYLRSVNAKNLPDNIDVNLLKQHLYSPEMFLCPADQERIDNVYRNNISSHNISIITFNYTSTIEKILGINTPRIESTQIGIDLGEAKYTSSGKIRLNSIYHVHGNIDEAILGINDKSQIANKALREDADVLDYLVKPRINRATGNLIDTHAIQAISKAKLIYIYGASLGNTDRMWWEAVGERIKQGAIVILFVHDENSNNLSPRKIGPYKRKLINKLCDAANIVSRNDVQNQIIIAVNTPVFDLKQNNRQNKSITK